MEWTDKALVLHVGRFREADMWVRLLTRRQGVLTVFAFGGSRSRRRFCGCLDIGNSILCRVKGTRAAGYLALQEASLLQGLRRLRTDGQRLGLAVNCLRFLELLDIQGEEAHGAFTLAEEILRLLEEELPPSPLLALLFRLRIASDQGFAPFLHGCVRCGRQARTEEAWQFLLDRGGLFCPDCRATGRYALELAAASLEFLRTVQNSAPFLWDASRLHPAERRQCGRVVDAFVQYHLGIAWEEGRFRRV
ncbi:MAG: DNA repair protein RecO [Deltaproteobacteria bacterium]|jgi:DNA repair protein RecO (recombination protein O)|nr:DNA repair protein RecO [Deltaproteobacteria bacterium]